MKDLPRPLASAEMALIRLAYASDLPTPGGGAAQARRGDATGPRHAPPLPPRWRRAARSSGSPRGAAPPPRPSPRPRRPLRRAAPAVRLARFEDVVALARAKRDIQLVQALEHDVRLERFEPGSIAFSLVEGASPGLAQTLARRLLEWTGERWMVALVAGLDRADLARDGERARGRARERRRGASAGAQGARALSRARASSTCARPRARAVRAAATRRPTTTSAMPIPARPADDDL